MIKRKRKFVFIRVQSSSLTSRYNAAHTHVRMNVIGRPDSMISDKRATRTLNKLMRFEWICCVMPTKRRAIAQKTPAGAGCPQTKPHSLLACSAGQWVLCFNWCVCVRRWRRAPLVVRPHRILMAVNFSGQTPNYPKIKCEPLSLWYVINLILLLAISGASGSIAILFARSV